MVDFLWTTEKGEMLGLYQGSPAKNPICCDCPQASSTCVLPFSNGARPKAICCDWSPVPKPHFFCLFRRLQQPSLTAGHHKVQTADRRLDAIEPLSMELLGVAPLAHLGEDALCGG